MAKEWILNSATNRFQLNFKRNVGPTSENVRLCQPRSVAEWETYYYANVKPKSHLEDLGRKLYVKISEVLTAELEEITEQDCIDYIINLVISRTYEGYRTEVKTIYGQLAQELDATIEPAPDEWDRLFNVDFFICIDDRYIGLQIKPAGSVAHIPQIFKERELQAATHAKFTQKYGGKVFYVISETIDKKKKIHNPEVIAQIRAEITRLGG